MPSPIPYTRVSSSMEPNGPHFSLLSTMRAASAGPIHGRRSSVSTPAVSTSTTGRGRSRVDCDVRAVAPPSLAGTVRLAFGAPPPFRPSARAAFTRSICASSASTSAGVGSGCAERDLMTRATTPSAAMAATTARARRSARVEGIAPIVSVRTARCLTAPTHPDHFPAGSDPDRFKGSASLNARDARWSAASVQVRWRRSLEPTADQRCRSRQATSPTTLRLLADSLSIVSSTV